MYQQQVYYLMNFLMLLDALIIIVSGYAAAWLSQLYHGPAWRMDGMELAYIALFLMFVNNFVMGSFRLYSAKRPASFLYTLRAVALSVVILFALLGVALFSIKAEHISRMYILFYAGLVSGLFALERGGLELFLTKQQRAGFNCHRIVIVGSGDRIAAVRDGLLAQKSWGHRIIGYLRECAGSAAEVAGLPALGSLEDLQRVLTSHSVDEIIFALSPAYGHVDLRTYIDICEEIGTTYRIVPALFDPEDSKNLRAESVQGIPTLVRSTVGINPSGMLYKRIVDYVVGFAGFLLFLAMFPLVALAIKLDTPGPVLYRQPRVGQHGRVFYIYKFRSMVEGADKRLQELMAGNEMNGHMFKIRHDPRITRVGRFLRATSLDEFPQFLNVIKGEMSLVGTRPPTQEEVARYEARHRRRISIRPGITGLWQVSGRSKIDDFEQVLKLDLKYIDNWRFWEDMRIIWKTVLVVLARKGAS
jgi:exopolysaccharide biosynthesis polyprenyl glycosylphosphotransferase